MENTFLIDEKHSKHLLLVIITTIIVMPEMTGRGCRLHSGSCGRSAIITNVIISNALINSEFGLKNTFR